MTLLKVEALRGGYSAADEIVKGASLEVAEGEIVAIIGPNGAGKSTLLKLVAGLLTPKGGRVRLSDEDIAGESAMAVSRKGLAFVPQEKNVFGSMSVRENLEMGGYIEPAKTTERIEAAFGRFPILAERRRQLARTLSGGERQILAIAMAMMVEPKILLLDEPTAGLSPKAAERLFDTVRAIGASGVSILMVEQNALEALAISARAYILVLGKNERDGPAAELAADPEIRRLFLGG